MLTRFDKIQWIEHAVKGATRLGLKHPANLHSILSDLLLWPDSTSLDMLVYATRKLTLTDAVWLTRQCTDKIKDINDLVILTRHGIRKDDRQVFILAHLDKLAANSDNITRINIQCIGNLFFLHNYKSFYAAAWRLLKHKQQPRLTRNQSVFFVSNTSKDSKKITNIPICKR